MTIDDSAPAAAVKRALRKQLKDQRAALSAEERQRIDALIADRVYNLDAFARADVLLSYLSFGSEVDTRAIIERAWAAGKTVALPRCVTRAPEPPRMEWFQIDSFADLARGPLGVLEPSPAIHKRLDLETLTANSLTIVPGLAFDANGYRLGYGGGFFDAFLAQFPGTSAGLCRNAFLLESLSDTLEPHDQPVSLVITEQHAIRAPR